MKIDLKYVLWLKYEKQWLLELLYFPSQHERSRKNNQLSFTAVMRTSEANSNQLNCQTCLTGGDVSASAERCAHLLHHRYSHVRARTHAHRSERSSAASGRCSVEGPRRRCRPAPQPIRQQMTGVRDNCTVMSQIYNAVCILSVSQKPAQQERRYDAAIHSHRRYPSEQKRLEIPPKYLTYSRPLKRLHWPLYG